VQDAAKGEPDKDASEEPKTSPSIVTPLPTKKIVTLNESIPSLTPLANIPLTRKPMNDELLTTEVTTSSSRLKAESRPLPEKPQEMTAKLPSVASLSDEEWKISQDHGVEEVRYDTMQQAQGRPTLVVLEPSVTSTLKETSEPKKASAGQTSPEPNEPPVSLEELRKQETVSGPVLSARGMPQGTDFEDLRRQETVQVPALPKEPLPKEDPNEKKVSPDPEVFAIPASAKALESPVSLQALQKHQTINLPEERSFRDALASLPQPNPDLDPLPSIATLPVGRGQGVPWWVWVTAGVGLLMVALLLLR
jgi:hypothetical protein